MENPIQYSSANSTTKKHHIHDAISRLKHEIDESDPVKNDTKIEQIYAQINNMLEIINRYYEIQEPSTDIGDTGISRKPHHL